MDVNLMEENVIQINSGITINVAVGVISMIYNKNIYYHCTTQRTN